MAVKGVKKEEAKHWGWSCGILCAAKKTKDKFKGGEEEEEDELYEGGNDKVLLFLDPESKDLRTGSYSRWTEHPYLDL